MGNCDPVALHRDLPMVVQNDPSLRDQASQMGGQVDPRASPDCGSSLATCPP